ncbi:pyridoxamine 5'-phosphate oxidase [Algoriphagus sp.]|jgi:pyridoxamine 5'-phosphate oxidase|uniref:pyridoxamine 5'-phosphate oxidase n=1 Tax=Algoriphagus sp. TaxID=1872435 RepID=UPI00271E1CB5|nr:pyridoxamine 5'-phosphate oxidase [Algoriphagus sp.]MDO8965792.1 pyridoxamine 5'-phosphate oxidase [Algoriphagus sp.]MDP3198887.1 pyridoxamine 5'-phosphate oxidase [Algoriphagus sp.]
MKLSEIRKDYTIKSLDFNDVSFDPFNQFRVWLDEAIDAEVPEVNAMCLSTLGLNGFPNARIVLLKEMDHGFVFFTNYKSEKGQEIEANPKASITFFWPELERQVRIMGLIEKVSEKESDEYFLSRPKGSQIGAWTSPQSATIADRNELNSRLEEMEKRFSSEPLTRPDFWGGYRLLPFKIEFWQGRPSRLHDRICYEKQSDGSWKISRLAP